MSVETNGRSPAGDRSELTLAARIRRTLLGAPRSIKDPSIFHRISLIAFLAWVGLGADGLSSSAYGPEESFRALGGHTYLAIALALATAFTVFIISYAYSRIVEHFPYGGGGYVVASKLLGSRFGVVSGSALLVDYVLTISVSIAASADQLFSVLPLEYRAWKLTVVAGVILILMILNLRGVKESVTVLMPVFLVFIISHLILLVGGIGSHLVDVGKVFGDLRDGFEQGAETIGYAGMFALFIRAYSMGAGTYTGIEAVSNGVQIMRDPKVETAKRTMAYMAVSLAVTAGGITILYLLFRVEPMEGKTLNAVLFENFAGSWMPGGFPAGYWFVVIALASEAALLVVAAQAGFIDGPRIMASMASDSWLPHRFSSLSDRLTMQNGVLLISTCAILTLILANGQTRMLVLMYSINVFLTFSLSEMGMVLYWIRGRKKYPDWVRHIIIHVVGLVLCLSILIVNLYEKLGEGGWITIVITLSLIVLCLMIKRHYRAVEKHLSRLDAMVTDLPLESPVVPVSPDRRAHTAVLLVKEYGGLGIHSLLSILRLIPNQFKNVIFISVRVLDAGSLKGTEELDQAVADTKVHLEKYALLARSLGCASDYRMSVGTEVLDEAGKLCKEIAQEFPRSIFFAGKLVFQKEKWYQRFLHNETAYEFQRLLQFDGLNAMVLPVRVFDMEHHSVQEIARSKQ